MVRKIQRVSAIDLFCGVGGLSQGLREAGVKIAAGFDIDPACKYPFESNIGAGFVEQDVRTVSAAQLDALWEPGTIRMLAGCAPCQPFSPYRRGVDTSSEDQWTLLNDFGRLVEQTLPELVTMENVPRLKSAAVFRQFVETLQNAGYEVSYKSCYGPEYGLPQSRRRLVLLGSRIGRIEVPNGSRVPADYLTVRDAIGELAPIAAGETHHADPLHKARALTDINIRRIRASKPGGTWQDWPADLLSPCHQRATGASFRNVYARMEWGLPSPTITTLAFNYGTGRFGHPEQDRPISLREAAILQGFPHTYRFVQPGAKVQFVPIGRLIGNAVPPAIARSVGEAVLARI